jgi:nitrilase
MPRVAAVQLEASHMDPKAGMERVEEFARRASGDGAEIIVFPELLVPGYPRYVPDPFPPDDQGKEAWEKAVAYNRKYTELSQLVPGPWTDQLGEIAKAVKATLVVGVSERDEKVRGRLYNTGVVIGPSGEYLGRHRKLVAVMHERMIFERGGVEDILTFDTPEANLGVCICFENHQPLFRRALGRLGEEIHCALWTGPATRARAAEGAPLEQHEALGIAHALDTGTFVVISSQVTEREPGASEEGPFWSHSGGSYIIDPQGKTLAEVPDWEEGIAIADLDLEAITDARLIWNHLGDDMRDDLFVDFAAKAAR